MTTNNKERVRGFVNVYPPNFGMRLVIHADKATAETCKGHHVLRTAELIELRPGETIVTREKIERLRDEYQRIAKDPKTSHQDCFCRSAQAIAIDAVLDILDGKDGA
jgi:hypothetical protein